MPNPPVIKFNDDRSNYSAKGDIVTLPPKNWFQSVEYYYVNLFHELVHSTGHEKRLGRPNMDKSFENDERTYAKEELVTEMGALFLSYHTSIEEKVVENAVAYIGEWKSLFEDDMKIVTQAAGQAHKAVDYILNREELPS